MKRVQGFTLIEILIVIGIVGVISIFAIPVYQNYLLKSYLTSALAEVNTVKIEYDILYNRNESSESYTAENIGLNLVAQYCDIEVYAPNTAGEQHRAISCLLKGHSDMVGSRIDLVRSKQGQWSCVIAGNLPNAAKPATCQ